MNQNIHKAEYSSQSEVALQKCMLKILIYFDIFNYPLTKYELFNCFQLKLSSPDELDPVIKSLESAGFIQCSENYIGLSDPAFKQKCIKRAKGNLLAKKKTRTAVKIARFIGCFPFVRAVYLSGTISKGYMEKESDIDFFIITRENRLWIARALLTLFKKTILLNSYKYFCINYFLDQKHLTIPDENLFTAVEFASLYPVCDNDQIFSRMIEANPWVKTYFPNLRFRKCIKQKKRLLKYRQMLEMVMGILPLNLIDDACYRFISTALKRKYKFSDHKKQDLALRSDKHVSKLHPNNFQVRILDRMKDKINNFEKKYRFSLKES